MKKLLRKMLIYSLVISILLPTWLAATMFTAKHALAAASVSGGGSAMTVNGSGNFFDLAPFIINSNAPGDINVAGVFITITTNTMAGLQFDTTAAVTARPSANLDLGSGNGQTVTLVPGDLSSLIIHVPVSTMISASGDSIIVSGMRVKATSAGVLAAFSGVERLRVGSAIGDPIMIDALRQEISKVMTSTASKINLTFSEPLLASTISATDFTVAGNTVTSIDATSNPTIILALGTNINDWDTPAVAIAAGQSVSDIAGNILNDTAIVPMTIDGIAPVMPIVNTVTSPVNVPVQTISGTAEAGSLVMISNGSRIVAFQQLPVGSSTFSIIAPLALNTKNQFSIVSADTAWNVSPVAGVAIVQDSIAPQAPVVDPSVYPAGISAITLTGTAEAGSKLTVTGGAINPLVAQLNASQSRFSMLVQLNAGVVNNLTMTSTDAAGNISPASNLTVDPTVGYFQAVVPNGFTEALNVNVPNDVNNATINFGLPTVNLDGTKSINVTGTLYINSLSSEGNVAVQTVIPAGTTLTGPSTWNGVMNAIQSRLVTGIALTADADKKVADVTAWEIGLGDDTLTFSQPIELIFIGQAEKSAGYYQNNKFTPITDVCDNLNSPTIIGNGECKGISGGNLIIWTKHLTQYVTYGQTIIPLATPNITVAKIEQNGSKTIRVEWQGIGYGVEKYDVFINNVLSATKVSANNNDTAANYTVDVNISDFGKFDVYVKATRRNESTQSEVKSVEFIAPVAATMTTAAVSITQSVAPAKAKASANEQPVVASDNQISSTNNTANAADDNGIIAGEDTPGEENVNWTPWIILFVLIVLAGAATGGYFFWFGSEEELETATSVPAKPAVRENNIKKLPPAVAKKKQPNQKKVKRW